MLINSNRINFSTIEWVEQASMKQASTNNKHILKELLVLLYKIWEIWDKDVVQE